jgi:hypothetical protein
MNKKFTIVDVEPDAMESPRNIRTAYLVVKDDSSVLEAFVSGWDSLHFRGKSLEEIKSALVGKKIEAEITFMSYPGHIKRSSESNPQIRLPNSADETKVVGKVLEIGKPIKYKILDQENESITLKVDCGLEIFEIEIWGYLQKQNQLKAGDYIEAEGRLDIHVLKLLDERGAEK